MTDLTSSLSKYFLVVVQTVYNEVYNAANLQGKEERYINTEAHSIADYKKTSNILLIAKHEFGHSRMQRYTECSTQVTIEESQYQISTNGAA